MDTKLEIGDYVTWGAEQTAHLVTSFTKDGNPYVSGDGFMLDTGEKVEGIPKCITPPFRIVPNSRTKALVVDDQAQKADSAADSLVTKPSHYSRLEIEPITFIMKNKMEFWRGNPIKYIARAGFKLYSGMDAVQSEITDLKKAQRMIEMRLNHLGGSSEL